MKHLLLALLLLCCAPRDGLHAQNIAIGERVPELKIAAWLDDRQPAAAPLTYIEFYHSSSAAATQSLDLLRATAEAMQGQLRVIVVVRESADRTGAALRPYVSPLMGAGFDPEGRTFSHFGVHYLPFGVLVDAKNRALWMGNSQQLTPGFIEKIAQ